MSERCGFIWFLHEGYKRNHGSITACLEKLLPPEIAQSMFLTSVYLSFPDFFRHPEVITIFMYIASSTLFQVSLDISKCSFISQFHNMTCLVTTASQIATKSNDNSLTKEGLKILVVIFALFVFLDLQLQL